MKISTRLLAFAAAAFIAAAPVAQAADMSFSTGSTFIPGPRLVDGTDLNVIVTRVNGLSDGSFPLTGNTTIGAGVNQVSLAGGATTVDPVITVGGTSSDTNIGLLIAGKGTGPVHLGGTDKTNGSVRIPTVASAVNAVDLEGAITTGIPFITVGGLSSDTNAAIAIYGKGTGTVLVGDSTTTLAGLQVAKTTSAVNGLLVTPGATGTRVALSASTAGADTNVGISVTGAGTGSILIGGATTTLAGLQVGQTASRVNDLLITPGATGTDVVLSSATAGADANAGIQLTTNGVGVVKLGSTTTCSGTTTATCSATRFTVSITGLSTAASTLSATMTVTNTSIPSSATHVICQPNGYGGTGIPVAVNVVPGTNQVTMAVQNVSTGAALNATVPIFCQVLG